ncbi:MAG: PQQ-dependent dehydrogenase, methanol/ethanol family [Gammaproteobacteria bacterium]|nr:PQQ-dependent dehydrogenase, methanol/ethanol family [Gammaproteobacteria bacterium]
MRLPVSPLLSCLALAPALATAEDLAATAADDAQWIMPAKNYQATRYSGLDQINGANVGQLTVAWEFSTGVLRGHESAPLVVGDTMYVVTPWPNLLYALDLNDAGAIKWVYKPAPARQAQGEACCDVVNRGAAYADGKIFFNTLDDYTIAVDAKSGREAWRTRLGDVTKGETMTMAPLVVGDHVLVGNSGGEMGVRGWLTALDTSNGHIAWRAYSTGPDEDVRIGSDFAAPYATGKDLGVSTWPKDAWRNGGGAVWGWLSYDPESKLVYYGTSNPGPWNANQRPGDNAWTTAVFARNPETGMAKWAYQYNPHDLYDYDGVNEHVVLDLDIGGQPRKVIVHADRNGYMYVLDRYTGRIVSAGPYVHTNTVNKVDTQTGRPEMNATKDVPEGHTTRDICPAASGGKDWQPMAYSPQTKWLYIPHNNLCMDMETTPVGYLPGTPFVGAKVAMKAGPGGNRGNFSAWDPATGKQIWDIQERFPVWSGALATGGGIVFYGTLDRWFKAVDAKTGQELFRFRTGAGVIGQPITYRGPDGRQYVAVLAGPGGWAGAAVAGDLDTTVPYGALGFVGAMRDLGDHTAQGGTLYVFALPQAPAAKLAAGAAK